MKNLKFSLGNSKLDGKTLIFDLPAGHTCPFAKACLCRVDRETGKLQDGEDVEFRCFGASSEVRFKNVRDKHWHNYDLLKTAGLRSPRKMADLIEASLAGMKFAKVRIHANGGDFFSLSYFKAWCLVAANHPDKIFYAYSKAIPIITREGLKPDNFRVVASWGGTHDELLEQLGYPSARVVYSNEEAEELGLKVDHDDSHAVAADHDFALLIHGTQPAGSEASRAREELRRRGWAGYSKNKKGAVK
jgi:hypothetical protein